tara:strand:+ start:1119 stop:1475 length:357 start_codon:yes stop_codon:yes gene_type:complete
MRNFGFVAMLLAASCGQSKAPVTPINPSDGGQAVSCEPALAKARVLYAQAAIDEGLAPNLHADFIEANTHMVMVDCQASPDSLLACVAAATTVEALEGSCLAPIDEAGEVEGRYFSTK